MEQILEAFLASYTEKSWKPGTVDCCLFLAAWAIWLGHRDPAASLRGTYDSEAGFRALVENAGGVVPLVSSCVLSIGGRRVQRPTCGDVGVLGSEVSIHRQFGAIYDGVRWRVRHKNAVGGLSARELAIWSI